MKFLISGIFPFLIASLAFGQEDFGWGTPELAEEELESLVQEWRDATPPGQPSADLGAALQALGIVERQMGKSEEAIEHLSEAVGHLADTIPASRADVLEALALCHQDAGNLDLAGDGLQEVLAIRREVGEPFPLALTLDHVALNHLIRGNYSQVRPLLEEALSLIPPAESTSHARIIGHLARFHHTLGSHARALELLDKALSLPFKDPELRLSLRSQSAIARVRLGHVEHAIAEFSSIAEDAITTFANNPLAASPYVNNLGSLDSQLGRFDEAATHFQRCISLLESSLGHDHPSLITPLNNLGVAWIEGGRIDDARRILDRCAALQDRYLPPIHLRVAETRRNLATVAFLRKDNDYLEQIDDATRIGLELLEELVKQGSERERLNFINRFDNVSLVCSTGDATRISDLLFASKGRLLDVLLSHSKHPTGDTDRMEANLAPGSVFVDTCRYQPVDAPGSFAYGAVIHAPGAPPKWVRLGNEDDLRRWTGLLHERLSWQSARLSGEENGAPPPMKMSAILKALHQLFWKPIEAEFPAGTQHIAWSPDGGLHFLPMAALLDENLVPLCHRYLQLTSVAHGRELLGQVPAAEPMLEPWTLVAVSHFPKPAQPRSSDSPLLTLLSSLRDMPGTIDEVERLSKIAPQGSTAIIDEQACESTLRGMFPPPSVLHLGCHAFYLADDSASGAASIDFDDHAELLQAGGLVLFNGVKNAFHDSTIDHSDDILYPSEIAQLDLRGTRLVTLSSCDSGRGTPVSGEGLLGLRRSFHLAGARQVLVALWPVSDAAAPAFMERFYELASHSGRPSQALWQTQCETIPRGDSYDFEPAVLRHASFMISQTDPLMIGGKIMTVPNDRRFSWLHEHPLHRRIMWIALPVSLIWLLWTLLHRKVGNPPET